MRSAVLDGEAVILADNACKTLENIHMDGLEMHVKDADRPSRLAESEKITLNVGHVDLGRMDLLVREGFYANRTDVMRTAIRALLDRNDEAVRKTVARSDLDLGIRHFRRAELEVARDTGRPIAIRVLGLAIIAADVDVELARTAISSIEVLGTLQADPVVKAALRNRTI